jgi:hypothetical protein
MLSHLLFTEKTPQPPIENQEISLIDKLIQGEQAKTSKWTVANIKAWFKVRRQGQPV